MKEEDKGLILSISFKDGIVFDGESMHYKLVNTANAYNTEDSILKDHIEFVEFHQKRFNISIKKISKCRASRRNFYVGARIFGYSVMLRLFNKDIL